MWHVMCKAGEAIEKDGEVYWEAATVFQKFSSFFIAMYVVYCMRATWNEYNFAVCCIQLGPLGEQGTTWHSALSHSDCKVPQLT